MIFEYGAENGVKTFVFRFPNLFGKMSRPNYSSVVATLCCETVKGLPLTIRDPSAIMKFAYVCDVLDDVVYVVLNGVSDKSNRINAVDKFFPVSLGELTYYMGVLKAGKPPAIPRSDDFFEKLSETYNWYVENIDCFKDVK